MLTRLNDTVNSKNQSQSILEEMWKWPQPKNGFRTVVMQLHDTSWFLFFFLLLGPFMNVCPDCFRKLNWIVLGTVKKVCLSSYYPVICVGMTAELHAEMQSPWQLLNKTTVWKQKTAIIHETHLLVIFLKISIATSIKCIIRPGCGIKLDTFPFVSPFYRETAAGWKRWWK